MAVETVPDISDDAIRVYLTAAQSMEIILRSLMDWSKMLPDGRGREEVTHHVAALADRWATLTLAMSDHFVGQVVSEVPEG